MGKKKTEARGVKLPKRVGSVKVPKALRKQGEALIGQARDAVGPELLASGLAVAAAALTRATASGDAAAPRAQAPGRTPVDYEQAGRVAGTMLAAAASTLLAAVAGKLAEAGAASGPPSAAPSTVPTPAPAIQPTAR